ncbi:MAG: glycosyltransferase family 9 protein [Bacteroidales bacterium]|nr:MAG: glycosyltransferase family 9 protein [Bacteroidales bacterium]
MKRILVFRLSAIGDVVMTVPVIVSLSKTYPDAEITFVSQKFAAGFIKHIPNVHLYEVDLKGRHKGFMGIFRLFLDLKRLGKFDVIADLHDVIRTKIIRSLYFFSSSKIVVIDKGRKEKNNLCRIEGKELRQLEATTSRYAKVFQDAGFKFNLEFDYLFTKSLLNENILKITGIKDCKWVGIAPFAKHKGKIYPLELMEKVISLLTEAPEMKVFLFGGGSVEKGILEGWEQQFKNTISLAGKLSLEEELKVISNLDVLLSMDSANMHFASLVNTSVISIWGATHPYAGFYGWNQNPRHAVQVDLPCRPCSIYGNKPCFRKDYACLYQITPESIIRKIYDEIIA